MILANQGWVLLNVRCRLARLSRRQFLAARLLTIYKTAGNRGDRPPGQLSLRQLRCSSVQLQPLKAFTNHGRLRQKGRRQLAHSRHTVGRLRAMRAADRGASRAMSMRCPATLPICGARRKAWLSRRGRMPLNSAKVCQLSGIIGRKQHRGSQSRVIARVVLPRGKRKSFAVVRSGYLMCRSFPRLGSESIMPNSRLPSWSRRLTRRRPTSIASRDCLRGSQASDGDRVIRPEAM